MAMTETRRILRLFLASPSDLAPERKIADEVILDLNKRLAAALGWQIELGKWEDTSPGFGRAQSLINPHVDTCDLFIGLLWERWGQPTGDYSSGFHEEYERALKRRKETGEPQIWLVFKSPRRVKLSDPGTELIKILEFQQTQQPEVFYKQVKDYRDWRRQLNNWLVSFLLDLPTTVPPAAQPEAPVAALTPHSIGAQPVLPAEEPSSSVVQTQLAGIAQLFLNTTKSGKFGFNHVEDSDLSEFDVIRLYLTAITWLSTRYTGDVIGTHEINLLYKYRSKLQAAAEESHLQFRTVIAGASDVTPGWFWFSQMSTTFLSNVLLDLAATDSSELVRRRALELMKKSKITLNKERWSTLPFNDDSQLVRLEAYDYISELGTEEALTFIKELGDNTPESERGNARESELRLLARLKPEIALTKFLDHPGLVPDKALQALAPNVGDLSAKILEQALTSSNDKIRELAARQLAKRHLLKIDTAEKLLGDALAEVRLAAWSELIRQGKQIDINKMRESLPKSPFYGEAIPTETLIEEYFSSIEPQQMLKYIDWLSVTGPLAYEFISKFHYELISSEIRKDIGTGFNRLRQRLLDGVKSEAGELGVSALEGALKEVDEFIRNRYLRAALEGLVANGEQIDVELARQQLSAGDDDVKIAAVKIISRFGSATDVPALVNLANNAWSKLSDIAASVALQLSEKPFEIAVLLAHSKKDNLVDLGFQWLLAQQTEAAMLFFKALLYDKSGTNRERAVFYLTRSLEPKQLPELLESYISGGDRYFYNVVTWLDRVIYAPAPLKEMYVQQLAWAAKAFVQKL